jgi:hypothetical protein
MINNNIKEKMRLQIYKNALMLSQFIRDNVKSLLFCAYLGFLTFSICHSIKANSYHSSDSYDLAAISETLNKVEENTRNSASEQTLNYMSDTLSRIDNNTAKY